MAAKTDWRSRLPSRACAAGGVEGAGAAGRGENAQRDAVAALAALGYKTADADQAVRRAVLALGPEAKTEELIRKALS